jgi:SAM-dependent methyltransferase
VANFYDADYFKYQAPMGEFGGWADSTKFAEYIGPSDTVLDFGCGGGYLLKSLTCARRLGVEINPDAREMALANGVEAYSTTAEVPDGSCDVVISNHALEHTEKPLDELRELLRTLRPGGIAVIVTPSESPYKAYRADDPNHHLYTWSPMNLGNLLATAGFAEVRSTALFHRWPPKVARLIAKTTGRKGFDVACRLYGRVGVTEAQSVAVGKKL